MRLVGKTQVPSQNFGDVLSFKWKIERLVCDDLKNKSYTNISLPLCVTFNHLYYLTPDPYVPIYHSDQAYKVN